MFAIALSNYLSLEFLLFSHLISHLFRVMIFSVSNVILSLLTSLLAEQIAYAHCDLPCGVYDPAQARIEAESVLRIMQKYGQAHDEVEKMRAILIKEQRAELVKHHLWVLWTDYFKPEHLAKYPNLHDLFWRATKAAGQTTKSVDPV